MEAEMGREKKGKSRWVLDYLFRLLAPRDLW